MESKKKNPNIHCTVQQCQHNMETECYCCLDAVNIGTHEANPTQPECVDCKSFQKRGCTSC